MKVIIPGDSEQITMDLIDGKIGNEKRLRECMWPGCHKTAITMFCGSTHQLKWLKQYNTGRPKKK